MHAIAYPSTDGCCEGVGDAALAEKLLIDVFLDVWRNAASFDGRSSVSTWLLAIAKTKALTARRSKPDAELAATVPAASDELELPLQGGREEVLRHSLARLSREYGRPPALNPLR
jgi:RNA polymerase sigma-70 factor, ECF subfamily